MPAPELVVSASGLPPAPIARPKLSATLPPVPSADASDIAAIELPGRVERDWPSHGAPVVVDFTQGSPQYDSWMGVHFDEDGRVWSYSYQGPLEPGKKCDYREIADEAARDACHYADSELVAHLTPATLRKLMRAVAQLDERDRIGIPGGGDHEVLAALKTTGRGTRLGRALVVGGCSTIGWSKSQLDSPEARVIIGLFRSLRRRIALGIAPCGRTTWSRMPEIRPGVPGWWMP